MLQYYAQVHPGQVEDLINKEKQKTCKLQALEKRQRYATAIAEEQYHQFKEARVNLVTPMTSAVETSEAENYG